MKLNDNERSLLTEAINRRVASLRTAAHKCSGDLYRRIYRGQADELETLLNKLLGFGKPKKLLDRQTTQQNQ